MSNKYLKPFDIKVFRISNVNFLKAFNLNNFGKRLELNFSKLFGKHLTQNNFEKCLVLNKFFKSI